MGHGRKRRVAASRELQPGRADVGRTGRGLVTILVTRSLPGEPVVARIADQVVARSINVVIVDDSAYFPADDVRLDLLRPSTLTTRCGRKGRALWADVVPGETIATDAAWSYSSSQPGAEMLGARWAFMGDVVVSGDADLLRRWAAETRSWVESVP